MNKKSLFLLAAAVVMIVAPSCKKQHGQWKKHSIVEEYEYVNPQQEEKKVEKAKSPRLWGFKAKWMVKDLLKENEIIKAPESVPVQIGYYECNCAQARENLYKAQVNGLFDIAYSEIKNQDEQPTYWVDVTLTPKGKALIAKSKAPVYPEDTITYDYMVSIMTPETGKNQYGEYTFDPSVDEDVVNLIKNFYTLYLESKNVAIQQYGTPDLVLAQQRISTAAGLGINRLTTDPFVRMAQFDTAAINAMQAAQWTSYVDLYIATIGDQSFCIVVKDIDGIKKIDDVALATPKNLNKNKTMRCTARDISALEMHNAQKALKNRPEPKKQNVREAEQAEEEAPELLYDEYLPQLQPGIVEVERTAPTLYQVAKECEHMEEVNLLAGEYKFKKLSKIKDVKDAQLPTKTAVVTIERTNVSPIGRIYKGIKNGETKEYKVTFVYEDDEWKCNINEME